jgi:hypothetical protein
MLPKLLIQDETTASLGKTENNFIVHIRGGQSTYSDKNASLLPRKLKNIAAASLWCFIYWFDSLVYRKERFWC